MHNHTSQPLTVRTWLVSLLSLAVVSLLITSCKQGADQQKRNTDQVKTTTLEKSIPDPSGTYADAEGRMTYTFLSTGKFYSEVLGDTFFGTWSRIGDEGEVTYDDGNAETVELGDGYMEAHGLRLTKR